VAAVVVVDEEEEEVVASAAVVVGTAPIYPSPSASAQRTPCQLLLRWLPRAPPFHRAPPP
jgi:hypothetical protein